MKGDVSFPTFLLTIVLLVGVVLGFSVWGDASWFDREPAEVWFVPTIPDPLPDWGPPPAPNPRIQA